jgi:glycine/D-amino acid oxidase-like deaminating enzyme
MENQKIEEIIIIGGGLMGSATAWQLSAAGEKVLLLEQQDSIYTSGSSFGDARITRSLGAKDDIFSWLQQTSVKQTQELLLYLNEADGPGTHSMEDIYTTAPMTYLFYESQRNTIDSILDGQEDPHDVATGRAEAKEKFGMTVSDSVTVIREYKPYTGTFNPKVLISKMQQGVLKKGNRIQYQSKVTRLIKKEGHYELEVADTTTGDTTILRAKKVVSATGPYTAPLLKEVAPYMEDLISTKRLFLAFIKPTKEAWEALRPEGQKRLMEYYPGIDLDEEGFYTMLEGEEDGIPVIKVGGHYKRSPIENLDEVWKLPVTEDEFNWARNRTLNYLRQLGLPLTATDLEIYKGYSCVYTLTESEIPLVSPLITNGQPDPSLVIITGMSGVGAKGSLAYGLQAARQVTGKTSDDKMYRKALELMGPERLEKDLMALEKEQAKKVAMMDSYARGFLFKGN